MSERLPIGEVLWQPTPGQAAASNLAAFARQFGVDWTDHPALHGWSVSDPEGFHARLWDYLSIIGERGERAIAPDADIRRVRFFPDARLCYAENLLRDADDRMAVIAHRDDGTRRVLTRRELRDLVSRIVQALRAEGIAPGDRVAAIVTNDIEAIAFYLATNAIGAIWCSCSPDFGPASCSDRLNQVEPRLLVAVPAYGYAGKHVDVSASIAAVASAPSVKKLVILGPVAPGHGQAAAALEDWLAPFEAGPIAYLRQSFDAPLAILFSSGTTGRPKCIVHGAGGLLLQHLKEQVLHCDLRAGDRLFYYTTCGWMMWNWLVSGLAAGACLVTYDGNPAYPTAARLPDLIDAEGISIFGTSAKYIDSSHRAGVAPRTTHSLRSLRTMLSTGSPLLPESFDYIYRDWKADLHLASISGGTDICACFLGGNPTLPVRRGELQGPMLGMDVAVLDGRGEAAIGVRGELACRNAHLSMPVGFWGDADGSRYQAAYFEKLPGVWSHGDFAVATRSGGFIIHGRSDTTLNPGGVRIGTAEIYRQLDAIPQILESVAVGQDWRGDQRIILFVRLSDGATLSPDLEKSIRTQIRKGATPRHVPSRIIAVADIPRTYSGKVSEVAVRETIHGRPIGNDGSLANPDCLANYRNLPELGV